MREIEKTDSAGPFPVNILYVAHRVPYPPDKGDRIRSYHVLRYLSRHAKVWLACLADEPVCPEALSVLEKLCARVAVIPLCRTTRWLRALASTIRGRSISEAMFYSPSLVGVLRSWAREACFKTSLASASSVAPYLRLSELKHVPAVIDLVDVDSQKWFDFAADSGSVLAPLYRREGQKLRQLEQELPEWASAVALVSEAEAELFEKFCSWHQTHVVTNGVALDHFQAHGTRSGEAGCVFVGALDYLPNIEAACWFAREVWPALRQRCSQARLRVVGRRPVRRVLRLAAIDGIDVIGQVPDVRPYLAQAAVAVVPLGIARGVQNKVLEAMAMARPVVASPQALAAFRDRIDMPALTATTKADWIEHITNLWANSELREKLGKAGRGYVERNHNWQSCLEPLGTLLGLKVPDKREQHGAPSELALPGAWHERIA